MTDSRIYNFNIADQPFLIEQTFPHIADDNTLIKSKTIQVRNNMNDKNKATAAFEIFLLFEQKTSDISEE